MDLCVYHRSDLDGIGSAAVVRLAYPGIQIAGYNYGEAYPKTLELLKEEEEKHPGTCNLIMVDISFPPEEMLRLKELLGVRFVWCDHHITAIEDSKKHGYDEVWGLRSTEQAAVQLTFTLMKARIAERQALDTLTLSYLQKGVNYLGDYDRWANEDLKVWEEEILPFQWGMRHLVGGNVDTCAALLVGRVKVDHPILSTFSNSLYPVMSLGQVIYSYEKSKAEMIVKGAFTIQFEGLKFLVLNGQGINSNTFISRWDNKLWDGMMSFGYSSKTGAWAVSMFTDKEGLDLSVIAKKRGGGGHMRACGFTLKDPSEIIGGVIPSPDAPR